MEKTTLKKEELEALKKASRQLSPELVEEKNQQKGNRYVFTAMRKTARAYGGALDVDENPTIAATNAYELVEITLISPKYFEYTPTITEADKKAAKPVDNKLSKYKSYYAYDSGLLAASDSDGESESAALPNMIDHRVNQSPVKDQGGRGTCVSHAAMGLLEAYPHINDNLSEQYTHFKFNVFLGRAHNLDEGLRTTDAAPFLSRNNGYVCLENQWPYLPNQSSINALVAAGTYAPPAAALNNQAFGIGAYKIIGDNGLTGESIKNTRYLEALLYQGYNIVFGCYASWDDKDNNGVLDPVLTSGGLPAGTGGHAMLIVGYNRADQYFIVKNSWHATWGHNGYGYFSYNFMRSCAKYGFVVDSVVPAAPPNPLPPKLVTAPYSTAKISRATLRAAIVFFKTTSGRFGVAEAYAGDNLTLRNLRVYNSNGSMHLTLNSLVIRSSYLCDLDTGRETSTGADFWWEGVRPGVHFLVPRNGATACVAYNLAALTRAQISTLTLGTPSVDSGLLNYAVITGKTTEGRFFKILAHAKAGNTLELSYIEVFNADGSRFKYAQNIQVPSSWTYNLDTLSLSGGTAADIWWHVISNNVAFLERYSTARMRLTWSL